MRLHKKARRAYTSCIRLRYSEAANSLVHYYPAAQQMGPRTQRLQFPNVPAQHVLAGGSPH